MRIYHPGKPRPQNGFSMIEVLTAVAVFGVGLAGMATMSLASLRTTADGQFNTQAMLIGEELADLMRANLAAYETSNFVILPEIGSKVCTSGDNCTMVEQAQYDSGKWQTHVVTELPGGLAHICMDSTPNDGNPGAEACDGAGFNTVKIFWLDTRNDDALSNGDTYHRYVVTVVP